MLKGVLDQLGSLALEEKHAVEEAARAAVTRELGPRGAGAPESCPRYGRPSFIGKGRNRNGSRRWPCRGARADILHQDDVAAGLLQAQARGLARLRVRHVVGHLAARLRRAVRRLPQDLLVHARAPARGDVRGPSSPSRRANPSRGRSTAPTRPSRSRATARARPLGCPTRPTGTGRSPRAQHIPVQSLRRLRHQRPGRLVLPPGGARQTLRRRARGVAGGSEPC